MPPSFQLFAKSATYFDMLDHENNHGSSAASTPESRSAIPSTLRDFLVTKVGSVITLHFHDPRYASFQGTLVEFDPIASRGSLQNPLVQMHRRFRVTEIASVDDGSPNNSVSAPEVSTERSVPSHSGEKQSQGASLPSIVAETPNGIVVPDTKPSNASPVVGELSSAVIGPTLREFAQQITRPREPRERSPRFGNLEIETSRTQLKVIHQSLSEKERGFEIFSGEELIRLHRRVPILNVELEKVPRAQRMKSSEICDVLLAGFEHSRPIIFDRVTLWFKAGVKISGVMTCTPECNIATVYNYSAPVSLKFNPKVDLDRIEIG